MCVDVLLVGVVCEHKGCGQLFPSESLLQQHQKAAHAEEGKFSFISTLLFVCLFQGTGTTVGCVVVLGLLSWRVVCACVSVSIWVLGLAHFFAAVLLDCWLCSPRAPLDM